MAEQATSKEPGHVLVTVGLGSCIGLALIDPDRSIAGLAHVILPDSRSAGEGSRDAWKFADTAVPALVAGLVGIGARKTGLEAVLVGGARMFSFAERNGPDVGHRNESAVAEALAKLGVPIRARATGGTRGRTVRVRVGDNAVTVREAGGAETVIYPTGGGPSS